MRKLNLRNLPSALLYFALAAGLGAAGLALLLTGLGAYAPTEEAFFWSPKLLGFGFAAAILAAASALLGVGQLLERDWGEVHVDSLPAEAYLAALAEAAPPSWTCTRCRVVERRRGLGTCIYCDSGTHYYSIDSDEDLQMVLSALG